MVLYNCVLCNFTTKLRSNYLRHLKSNKHLFNEDKEGIVSEKEEKVANLAKKGLKKDSKRTQNDFWQKKKDSKRTQKDSKETQKKLNNFECEYCGIFLKTRPILLRHIRKYCKEKKNMETLYLSKIEDYKNLQQDNKNEKDKLYQYIEQLIEKTGDTINIENQTTNQLNNQTNTNNTITLNNFGEEDVSHITDKFKIQMLKLPYGGIQQMIEKVHFSDKKPENRNIALTNKRDKIIKVLNKKKWRYQDKDFVIDELIRKNYTRLDEYYEEFGKLKMTNIHNKRYQKFQKRFDTDDETLLKRLKKETEMILLSENL